MKNNKLKYLSKSMLLEEEGIPRINMVIALTICITVVLFIVWASFMEIKDVVNISGVLDNSAHSKNIASFAVTSDKIGSISKGNIAYISIPGITKKDQIKGVVDEIISDVNSTKTSYLVIVELDMTDRQKESLDLIELEKLDVSGEIITGKRSILKYILGPLWDIGEIAVSD